MQGLEENKAAMTVVTEPIFASVANVLGHLDNIANFPKGLKGLVSDFQLNTVSGRALSYVLVFVVPFIPFCFSRASGKQCCTRIYIHTLVCVYSLYDCFWGFLP